MICQRVAVHPPSIELFQLFPNDQLKPSDPTTPGEFPLRLLPSGPDLVRGTPPRGTQLSTHHEGDSPTTAYLKREFDPGRASSGLQGIANSPSSTADRKCSESTDGCQSIRHSATPAQGLCVLAGGRGSAPRSKGGWSFVAAHSWTLVRATSTYRRSPAPSAENASALHTRMLRRSRVQCTEP